MSTKSRFYSTVILSFILSSVLSMLVHASDEKNQSSGEQKKAIPPLIRLDATSIISGDIGEGGFDARVQGGRWFISKLHDCGAIVADIGRKWSQENDLAVVKDYVENKRAVLHISSGKTDGFFELLYRLSENSKEASVSVNFFGSSGLPVAPELADFQGLGLISFASKLKAAIQCKP